MDYGDVSALAFGSIIRTGRDTIYKYMAGALSYTDDNKGNNIGAIRSEYQDGKNNPFRRNSRSGTVQTVVDGNGLHLMSYGSGENGTNVATEKTTVTLLNPDSSTDSSLYDYDKGKKSFSSNSKSSQYSVIFATSNNKGNHTTAGNATGFGIGTGNNQLGLLVGTLAAGSYTGSNSAGGFMPSVFTGFNNGYTPTEAGQPTIFPSLNTSASKANGERAGAVVYGSYNSVIGNSGLAIGNLNRVYGNGGVVIANTSIGDAYSSVGRFGITMGFNVKAGEWSRQSVAIGANMQAVGYGNIILGGGGQNKFYGTTGGWNDIFNTDGTYQTVGNVLAKNDQSGMRFWGNLNTVIGADNRTEGFNPNVGQGDAVFKNEKNKDDGGMGDGFYNRIANNSVTGSDNSIRDLSFRNSIFGSENILTSGDDNMLIGSKNNIQAAYSGASLDNKSFNGLVDNTEEISKLYLIKSDKTNLLTSRKNSVIGSSNTIGYNSANNFLAGSNNYINFNIATADFAQIKNADISTYLTSNTKGAWSNANLIKTAANNNIVLGSNIAIGTGTQNNTLLGSNIIVANNQTNNYALGSNILFNASNAYVLGSNVNVISNNSVYIGDYSTATLKKTINTAGESGFTNYTIRGMTFNFAGIGETDGGVVTFGRIENGKSVGRVLQNVAPGLIGPNSTDAVNGSQLYALWNFVNNNTVNFVTGSGGATVTQNEPNREESNTGGNSSAATTQPNTPPNTDTSTVPSAGETTNNTEPAENATNTNNSSTTNKLEPNTFNVHVEQTVAYVDDGGDKLTKVKGKDGKFYFYKEKDTSGKAFNATDGKWYEINGNTLEALSDEQAPKQVADEHVLMVAKLVNPKDGSVTTPAQLANIASALNVDTKEAPVSQDKAREVVAGSNKDGNGGLLAKSGTKMNTAANLSDLQAVAQAGTTFVDDQGNEIHRPLGTALNIRGGATGELSSNNIGVVKAADDTLEIKLAKELKGLTSAQFIDDNGNTTVVNGNGITITNSNNPQQQVSVTSSGLNNGGNRITNVAPGVADTDAVNLGQMKQALGGQMKDLSEDIDGVAATAGAMSGLPQAYIPGKSMVAIGTGAHRSQQAVAIGISRVSDNGKIVLKLNAGHNTAGNTTVGAGVGFQF
ncbi:YadA C-terminal domain-containing protein [Gallibacterium salpingitidis]|uniref:YadA C-terminal domain-containing protein n=1 Tax=Gallibacterium salpingitidis TaxID=505341 RepID=UPI00082539AB|nr:YadA C-terminal domain-containing protein [Gallibacterium salpingitidis]